MTNAPLLVAEALSAQCRTRPDALAVADDRRSLTYEELAQLTNGLADRLPPAEGPVVVLVDRRVASIAAIAGVLWAGRAVVAVDASDPRARILDLVAWSDAVSVVDASGTTDGADDLPHLIAMDEVAPSPGPPRPLAPDTLAHLLLTSGSTGRPKGVPRTAAQLDEQFTRWLEWTDGGDRPRAGADIGPLDGAVAALVPLIFQGGFTASVFATSAGRRVELIDAIATDVRAIADRIDDRSIENITLTPSHIRSLGRGLARNRRLESVREVFGVGEASEGAHVEAVRAFASTDVVYRMRYGASEIIGTFNAGVRIGPDIEVGPGPLHLGAMPGADRARLEPIDGRIDVGELIVRAPVIDRYWKDSELSARSFGTDPDGTRYWRTGDLMAVDEHDILHTRGRIDDMAKINGRLVEPAESENALRMIPGVRGAVALPRRLPSGRQQLVGHVEADPSVSASHLRNSLLSDLPSGIVPGVLVRHDHLPLNSRGKLDRVALRAGSITPWTDTDERAPNTSIERSILGIVARMLDIESLGVDDDLFAIGCDSLGAIELIEILSETFDVTLTANELVDAPTTALLAELITSRRAPSIDWVVRRNMGGPRPMIHLICGGGAPAIQYQPLVDNLGPDQPVALYEQFGLHHRTTRDRTINRAVRRHLPRLLELSPTGPIVLVGHSYGGFVANDMAIALDSIGRNVHLVVLDAHAWRPSENGPPDLGPIRKSIALARRTRLGLRPLNERLDRFRSMDDETRYGKFFSLALRAVARHRLLAFDGPTLYVRAAVPDGEVRWPSTPSTQFVVTPGDHNSLLQYRNTSALISEVVDRAITI